MRSSVPVRSKSENREGGSAFDFMTWVVEAVKTDTDTHDRCHFLLNMSLYHILGPGLGLVRVRSCQPIILSPLQACHVACFRNVLQLRMTEAARFEVFATSDCQSGMRFIRLPFHAFGVASFGKTCHIATPKWHYVKCTLFQQAEVACSKSLPLWRVGMACF